MLSRRTRIATNARAIVDAAGGKEVLFFPARFDHHLVQTGDGYAAYISGALGVSTDANAEWWGSRGMGTVPHALIAAYGGDTVLATQKFAQYIDPAVNVISLVDFDNDCVGTSLAVARALGERLWGVRLDTSGTLVDASVIPQMGTFPPTGVNAQLVHNVRDALDAEGFSNVRIVVSGGFDAERIRAIRAATACRSTPTRSAARSSKARARSISPPTSSRSTTAAAGTNATKSAAPSGPTRGSRRSTKPAGSAVASFSTIARLNSEQVVRVARGDPVAVLDDGLIAVEAAGVADVVGDRGEAGQRAAAHELGRDQDLRAVADHEHRLLRLVELLDETLDVFVDADVVGRLAARDQDRVEVVGGHVGDQLFGFHALAFVQPALAADLLQRLVVDADDRHDGAGFFQRPARLDQFRFLESVARPARRCAFLRSP